MKVTAFDVMAEMGRRDSRGLRLAPISNITNMQSSKKGDLITFGTESGTLQKIYDGEVVGGFILMDKKEFDAVKMDLESADKEVPE